MPILFCERNSDTVFMYACNTPSVIIGQVKCPVCGKDMEPLECKSNGESEDAYWENYACPCGQRFTVEVSLDPEE